MRSAGRIFGTIGVALISFCLGTVPGHGQGKTLEQQANDTLNKSLSTVGQCVVVTVSSTGAKAQEFHAKIPGDKYSPDGDNTAMSVIEVSKRLTEAIDKAKKSNQTTTITIQVERKVPDHK